MKTLYEPSFEHDNCGIGAVASIDGIKSHKVVENALSIVEKLEHRAGKDASGETGDGVGILVQVSHQFSEKEAKALGNYSDLAEQGFARQHSDWLVGINGTRFITNMAGPFFPIGRVQTSILAAISERCRKINDFKPEKYYEIIGSFAPPNGGSVKGILINQEGETKQNEQTLG